MPMYWLISDRNNNGVGQGMNTAGLTYWVSDGGDLTSIGSWQKVRNAKAFQTLLATLPTIFRRTFQMSNKAKSRFSCTGSTSALSRRVFIRSSATACLLARVL